MKRAAKVAAGSLAAVALALGALCLTSGCSSVGYLAQSAAGHLGLLAAARPVSQWLADPATPERLRERLALAQRMREFAARELQLPDNRSYTAYADLGRPAALWNVVATPELSLTLKTWCFPVAGCVGYRGYFDLKAAQREAQRLREQGLEAVVYPVPAYSTLGWSNWLGGDPLLNTFVNQGEGGLARLIFHELAHQVVYVKDDTAFNESFAAAVEELGSERWLAQHASEEARRRAEQAEARRREFRALVRRARATLDALYRSDASDEDKRRRKAEIFEALRAEHERLKAGPWQGYTGYDAWFERANNAALAVHGAYDELVPAFLQLYEREGRDFGRFYAAVRRLAALDKRARREALGAPAVDQQD